MHFLVIGATGQVGRRIVTAALAGSHTVTALVRDAAAATALLPSSPALAVLQGSPRSEADLAAALTPRADAPPVDAVLVALRLATTSASPLAGLVPGAPPRLGAETVRALAPAMRAAGVRRLVVLSSQGVGASLAGVWAPMRALFRHSNMRLQLADHEEVDGLLRTPGGPEFVLVRSVMMAEGPARKVVDHGDEGTGAGWMPSITRDSVAEFMVRAASGSEFVGRSPVISN